MSLKPCGLALPSEYNNGLRKPNEMQEHEKKRMSVVYSTSLMLHGTLASI